MADHGVQVYPVDGEWSRASALLMDPWMSAGEADAVVRVLRGVMEVLVEARDHGFEVGKGLQAVCPQCGAMVASGRVADHARSHAG